MPAAKGPEPFGIFPDRQAGDICPIGSGISRCKNPWYIRFVGAVALRGDAGTTSYVIKDSPVQELAKAVERTRSGYRYIDPQLALNLAFARNAALSPRDQRILNRLLDDDAVGATDSRLHA